MLLGLEKLVLSTHSATLAYLHPPSSSRYVQAASYMSVHYQWSSAYSFDFFCRNFLSRAQNLKLELVSCTVQILSSLSKISLYSLSFLPLKNCCSSPFSHAPTPPHTLSLSLREDEFYFRFCPKVDRNMQEQDGVLSHVATVATVRLHHYLAQK
jgi:hypothetical protein